LKFTDDILNAKYFKQGSRERLKATILTLLLLLATLIMILDVYESMVQGYLAISIIEGGSAIIFMIAYALFPKRLSLKRTINIALGVLTFLFIISLTLQAANTLFALFWLPTLAIHYFFFAGLQGGLRWTMIALGALIVTTLNAYTQWYPPLYEGDFMLLITIAYASISYLLYVLEQERFGYEKNLEISLKDIEVLLKEVHHRTKNNMQIMIGLLDTQSFKIENKKYKDIFQAHINRITSMATIHEYLYMGQNYESVEMQKYLGALIHNLQALTPHTIVADIDPLMLDMKRALNLSLVFNEALTNAIEHAYDADEEGSIKVALKPYGADEYLLTLQDYGKGFDTKQHYNTLGMTLLEDIGKTLSFKPIEIQSDARGTSIQIYCNTQKDR